MGKFNSFFSWMARHKYAASIVLFGVLIGMVDENSLYHRWQSQQELSALKAEIRTYKERYENDTRKLDALTHDIEEVRRIARERYYMHRPGEDVYVFADTTATNAER